MCSAQPILAVFPCRAGTMPRPGCHRNLSSLSCHSSDWQCKCLQIHLWDTTLLTHELGHWGDLSHSKLMMALSHHVKGLSKRELLAWGLGLHTSQPGNRNCPESRLCTLLACWHSGSPSRSRTHFTFQELCSYQSTWCGGNTWKRNRSQAWGFSWSLSHGTEQWRDSGGRRNFLLTPHTTKKAVYLWKALLPQMYFNSLLKASSRWWTVNNIYGLCGFQSES